MTIGNPDILPQREQVRRLTNTELFNGQDALMRDKSFLVDIAAACDDAYRTSEIDRLTSSGQPVEDWLQAPLFSDAERTILSSVPAQGDTDQQQMYDKAHQKLAMGLPGFYALSEGLGMIAEDNPTNSFQASDTLQAVIAGTENERERNIMSRLAHVAWAAGQPYRNRETRPVMKPWDKLPPEEKHKDMVQIRAAAKILSSRLSPTSPPTPTT